MSPLAGLLENPTAPPRPAVAAGAQVHVIEPDPAVRSRLICMLAELGCQPHRVSWRAATEHALFACDLLIWNWVDWVAHSPLPPDQQHLPVWPRVILVSPCPNEADWLEALRAGAYDLVETPHSRESAQEFRRVLRQALGLPRDEES
ncbi:MAG: hypothetical protein ACRD5W_11535 [Candidatus Acidiferrales bacterium]